jgi:hypothetical protein
MSSTHNLIEDTMKPNIEIAENHLKDVAPHLDTVLADEYLLFANS